MVQRKTLDHIVGVVFLFQIRGQQIFSWNWFIPLIFHEFFLPLNCKQCHQILAHPLSYCWRICQNSTAEGRIFLGEIALFLYFTTISWNTRLNFNFTNLFFLPPDTYLAHDKHIHIVGVGWYDHIICHKTLFFVKSHKFRNLCVFTEFLVTSNLP